MKNIFKIRTRSCFSKDYYVVANDYQDAIKKFESWVFKQKNQKQELDRFENILDSDGSIKQKFLPQNSSLNSNDDKYKIVSIELEDGEFIE